MHSHQPEGKRRTADSMAPKAYILDLVICCVFISLSFWALTWHKTHRLLQGDIDGVLLVAICLLVESIFCIQLLLLVRSLDWLKSITVPRHSVGGAYSEMTCPAHSRAD
jgi:hypothetical protein